MLAIPAISTHTVEPDRWRDVQHIAVGDRRIVPVEKHPRCAAVRRELKIGLKIGIVQRGISRRVGVPVHREASDHRPEYLGLALNGAVAVPAH